MRGVHAEYREKIRQAISHLENLKSMNMPPRGDLVDIIIKAAKEFSSLEPVYNKYGHCNKCGTLTGLHHVLSCDIVPTKERK